MQDGSEKPRQWYALYTYPRHEKSTAEWLGLHQIETFLPTYAVARRWKNRCTRLIQLPLFPRYLFARFSWVDRVQVLGSKSVVSIVSAGREPVALADSEIEALRIGLPQHKAEPHPYLRLGQRARIRSGALAGMEGVILRKKNSFRVVLTLEFIMQSVSVEVDGADLELVRIPASPSLRPSVSGTLRTTTAAHSNVSLSGTNA
jgi:transcription antitermination factor NusG